MDCFKALSFSVLTLCTVTSPALAQCRVCDEVIILNAEYATCFAQIYDQKLNEVSASEQGRIEVNLAECGAGTDDKDRSGLMVMPSITGQAPPPKSVYILDAAYLQCLGALLADYDGPFDPQAQFDLFEQCQ